MFIVGNILSSVVDETTTEELLGVGAVIEDDTEGGGHVDGLAGGVEVDVLSGVSASVTVHIVQVVSDIWLRWIDWGVYRGRWLEDHRYFLWLMM